MLKFPTLMLSITYSKRVDEHYVIWYSSEGNFLYVETIQICSCLETSITYYSGVDRESINSIFFFFLFFFSLHRIAWIEKDHNDHGVSTPSFSQEVFLGFSVVPLSQDGSASGRSSGEEQVHTDHGLPFPTLQQSGKGIGTGRRKDIGIVFISHSLPESILISNKLIFPKPTLFSPWQSLVSYLPESISTKELSHPIFSLFQ